MTAPALTNKRCSESVHADSAVGGQEEEEEEEEEEKRR
jgi:hypothetical protein